MKMSNKVKLSTGVQSKITKYKLEEECVALKEAGLSYAEIAEELNRSDMVPEGDSITKQAVYNFFKKIPKVKKEIVKDNKARMLKVVDYNLDIISEINNLYGTAKHLLDEMEEQSSEAGKHVNPYQFKAVVSEMRELLKQMTDIQRELNDYQNIRQFMEVVLDVLYEQVPEQIPYIVDRLKMAQGTQWFANIVTQTTNKQT